MANSYLKYGGPLAATWILFLGVATGFNPQSLNAGDFVESTLWVMWAASAAYLLYWVVF